MQNIAPLLLIVGAVSALKSKLNPDSMRSQASLMSEQTGNNIASCQKTIVDWKRTQLKSNIPDYCKLGEGPNNYVDNLFPAKDTSIYWKAMKSEGAYRPTNQAWMRMHETYPTSTLFGS
jgi:hypothetical protein